MSTLNGTNIDPNNVNDAMARMEVFKGSKRKEVASIREELDKWKSFEGTRTGQIVCNLARPMIASLNTQINMSVVSLANKLGTSDKPLLDEYRAECRGALGVWESILYKSSSLEGRLNEINKFEEVEDKLAESRAKRNEKMPHEVEKFD